jgi:hypothetical protein
MTYDRQSTYLTWGGLIGPAGEDTWQTGVHLALHPTLDGPGLPTAVQLLDVLNGPIKTFHTAPGAYIAGGCLLTWAKCAQLDNTGAYTAEPVYQAIGATFGGAVVAARGAPQVSMVITLYSGQSLGHANFGRLYMPWWEAQVTDQGHVTPANTLTAADAAKTLIDGINAWAATALSATARVMIMSKVGGGQSKLPTTIRVGDVKDTQQRRRRQLREAYEIRPVA